MKNVKTRLGTMAHVALLLLAALVFTSCSEDKDDDAGKTVGSETLNITPSLLEFSAAGGTKEVQTRTTAKYIGWKTENDWITCEYISSTHCYNVTAAPNPESTPREGTVTIFSTTDQEYIDESVTLTVKQAGSSDKDLITKIVGTKGGTITSGDMALTILSGTFTSEEASVSVKTMEEGSVGGSAELSPFYEIELPSDCRQPITISLPCKEKTNDIVVVMRTKGGSTHTEEELTTDYPLPFTVKDGICTATIPASDNEGESSLSQLVLGIADAQVFSTSSARAATRSEDNGDFTFTFDYGWDILGRHNYRLVEENIREELQKAVSKFKLLGFRVKNNRNVPVSIINLENNLYGLMVQSNWSNENNSIQLNKKKISISGGLNDEMKATIYHEMLHYFQAEYDTRSCIVKASFDFNGEYLMMYEAGGVWAEKFSGSNTVSTVMLQNLPTMMKSFKPLEEDYKGMKASAMYSGHGYAYGTILEYMSQHLGDSKIVNLYKLMRSHPKQTFRSYLEKFGLSEGYNFFDNYDDFVYKVFNGKVYKITDPFQIIESTRLSFSKEGASALSTIHPYGCDMIYVKDFYKYIEDNNNELTVDTLVITQGTQGLITTVYYNSKNSKELKELGTVTSDKPLYIIKKSFLKDLFDKDNIHLIYLVTNQVSILNANKLTSRIAVKVLEGDEQNNPDELIGQYSVFMDYDKNNYEKSIIDALTLKTNGTYTLEKKTGFISGYVEGTTSVYFDTESTKTLCTGKWTCPSPGVIRFTINGSEYVETGDYILSDYIISTYNQEYNVGLALRLNLRDYQYLRTPLAYIGVAPLMKYHIKIR